MDSTLEQALEDTTPSMEKESPLKYPHEETHISLHALSGFSTPQTLKLIGYIKHHKIIVLIDSGSTHNFIHKRVT
jgi:hypothetical protein